MCEEDEALFSWIDVERPIKWMLMCEEDEALFGWIDIERPIKWTFIQNQKINQKTTKKKQKEFVLSSPGQNVRLLSLPYS